jgi:hypothetical protein
MPSIRVGGLNATPAGGSIEIAILVVELTSHQRRRRCSQTYSRRPFAARYRRATGESCDGGAGSRGESTIAGIALIDRSMIPPPSDKTASLTAAAGERNTHIADAQPELLFINIESVECTARTSSTSSDA